MKNKLFIILLFLCGNLSAQLHPGFNQVKIYTRAKTGTPWFYYFTPCEVWCPADWDQTTSKKYPVIFSYHGTGEAGTDTVAVKREGIMKSIANGLPAQTFSGGQEIGFVVIAPQAASYGVDTAAWPPNFDDATSRLMMSTGAVVKLDSSRVYLTGYSAGGWASIGNTAIAGTTDTVYSNYIAATVPMSPATQDLTWNNVHLAAFRNIHFLGISGGNDVSFNAGMLRVRDTIQHYSSLFPLAVTVAGWGHGPWSQWWDSTYLIPTLGINIYKWLLQWRKGTGNSPPNVSAGPDQTISQPTSSTTVTGTASGNNGATINSVLWTFLSGPVTPTLVTPATLNTTISGLSAVGVYKFRLQATDNNALVNTDDIQITVQLAGTAPIVSAGGTYNVTTYNGFDVVLTATESTGNNNIRYVWTPPLYYTGNDKSTHLTTTGGEGVFINLKGDSTPVCHVIQMKLQPGDSVRKFVVRITATDTITNLFSVDSAFVFLRYPNDYPPQNVDGAAGGHRATSGDCITLGAPCTIGKTWTFAANADAVKDASGVAHFTSFYMFPNFQDTFHVDPGFSIRPMPGTYKIIKLLWDTAGSVFGPLGDTTKAKITIDGKGVKTLDIVVISNIRNTRITNFKTDNNYQSIAGFGINIDGMSSAWVEVDHDTSIRGNFTGFTIKFEYAGLPNPATHAQVFWDRFYVHDNLVTDAHGEDYYFGSANVPAVLLRNCRFSNNISLFSGNKLFKTLDLVYNDTVDHNVGTYGSINYASPFEEDVSVGQEIGIIGGGIVIDHNLIYGFGNQGLNLISNDRGIPHVGPAIKLSNNFWAHSWGPIGTFLGQFDSAFTMNFDSCYFGLHGPFNFQYVYNPGSHGTNTALQNQALPSGALGGGATRSTYNITNSTWDNTKTSLFGGDAHFTSTANTNVALLVQPTFVNVPFTGVFPEQWVDQIMAMWGDEYPEGSDTKQGQNMTYGVGRIVKWFDKFYSSKVANNTNHVPNGVTDAWWTLLSYNELTSAPIDVHLLSTDPYAIRGIGLLTSTIPTPPVTGDYNLICNNCVFK